MALWDPLGDLPMTTRRIGSFGGLVLVLTTCISASFGSGDTDCPSTGPDVVVSDIFNAQTWGTLDGEIAFTIGTDACNVGDEVLDWIADTPEHPVIAQSLYRIKNGNMEQIGVAWLKHGFGALQDDRCSCTCVPADYQHLGVGCADAYSAALNGIQTGLGPRLDVNPHTGFFAFPPSVWGESGSVVEKRIRVDLSKIESASEGNSTYVVEAQYVSSADSAAENQANNVSWRACQFVPANGTWQMVLTGETQVAQSAVEANACISKGSA